MSRFALNIGFALAIAASPLRPAAASTPTGYVQENGAYVGTYSDPGDANAQSSVSYNGGTTMQHAILQVIFWGSNWKSPTQTPSEAYLTGAVQQIISGTYLDEMYQYDYQDITLRGILDVDSDPPSPFGEGDVENLVWGLIGNGTFPNPVDSGGHIIFMVFVPEDVPYDQPNVTGEHSDPWRYDASLNPPTLTQRAWVAWAGGALTNGAPNPTPVVTRAFVHELVESISDPEGGAFLMDKVYNNDGPPNEIGDACDNAQDTLDGIAVQGYFSGRQNACVIPFPPPPVFYTVSPDIGSPWGGNTIQIVGTGFDTHGATTVTFGGVQATDVNCPDSNDCFVTQPGGNGVVDVQVKVNHFITPTNAANDQFAYSPSVTGVSPNSGNPGDTVTIYGIGVLAGSTVLFGNFQASDLNCEYPPGCTVTVPPGSGLQDVRVMVNGVVSRATSVDQFQYHTPTISSIEPSSGPWTGGTEVTIIGQGFDTANDNGMQVLFGGVPAPLLTCYASTWCLAYTPAVAGPSVQTVTADIYGVNTVSSPPIEFTFTQFPTLEEFNVFAYETAGGLSLNGNAPPGGARVRLHSSAPEVIKVKDEVTIPEGQSGTAFNLEWLPSPRNIDVHLTARYQGVKLEQSFSIVATPPVSLTVAEHPIPYQSSTTATVSLLHPAPAGGAEVKIAGSNAEGVEFPAHVKVPERQYSATFTITNDYDGAFKEVTLTASYDGHSAETTVAVPAPVTKPPPICPGPGCI